MAQETKKIDASILNKPLVDCNLLVRALCCCMSVGIKTIADLVAYNKIDLLRFRNFGKKSITELDDLLYDSGLEWGTNYIVNEDGNVVKASQTI